MTNLKRFLCLNLTTIVIVGFLFNGCSDKKTTDEGTTDKNIPQLNCYFLAPKCDDLELVEEELNKGLKSKINATVKLNYFFWDSYKDKQQLLIASGEKIDIMFSATWWGFPNFVSKKAFLPLDELLEEHGKDIIKNIPSAYLKAPRANGKLYAIPTSKDMTGVGGILINKDLADKYDFDLSTLKKPEDLEPMLKVIKENEPGITPFLSTRGDHAAYLLMNFYENIIQADVPIGINKTEGDPKVCNLQETPENIKIVQMSRDWYNKGYINKDVATLKDGMPIKKAQKAFAWGEQLKPGKDDEMKAQLGYEVVQINSYADVKPYATTSDLTNSMLVIPRTSENPEKAMAFINILFKDKEIKNLLSWGVEDKHYKKVGDNKIDFADGVDANNSKYTGMAQWSMGGDQFLDYLWKTEKDDKWEKMKEFNDSAIISKSVGWTFEQESVKTEIASLATIGKEYGEPISSGIVDYDKHYPKMKKLLKNAGMDKVIEEAQRQLDEFIKNSDN
ncbi:MAG: ABC transporter substrate-binding protein [Clostridiales bacterium]